MKAVGSAQPAAGRQASWLLRHRPDARCVLSVGAAPRRVTSRRVVPRVPRPAVPWRSVASSCAAHCRTAVCCCRVAVSAQCHIVVPHIAAPCKCRATTTAVRAC
jgi:hypothetical protein